MSKLLKVCIPVFCIGILMTCIGVATGGYQGISYIDSKIIPNKNIKIASDSYNLDNIKKIDLNVDNVDSIDIIKSDSFKIDIDSIEFDNSEKLLSYNVSEDGEISIKNNKSDHSFFLSSTCKNDNKQKIKIYVKSDAVLQNLSINSDYSDINISDIQADNLSFSNSFGSIKINNSIVNDSIKGNCSTGNVKLDTLTCNKINLDCDFGSVNVENITADNAIINGDTLECSLSNLSIKDTLNIDNEFGKSDILNGNINNIKVNSDSGNVRLSCDNFNNADVVCKFGAVTIDTNQKESLFNFDVSCSNSSIAINGNKIDKRYINNTNQQKNIKISSDCGNIKVNTGK